MKSLITLILVAGLLTACSKKEDPQPIAPTPAVQAKMTRTFTFPNNSNYDTGLAYTQKSMQITGNMSASELALAFTVPEGSDFISFTMPVSALSTNLQGTYQLRDRQNSPDKVVETRYSYTTLNVAGASAGQLFFSNSNNMMGKVVITAYDSQRRLLNGSFEMAMDGVSDPRERYPSTNPARCNVKVIGTFENLKLE